MRSRGARSRYPSSRGCRHRHGHAVPPGGKIRQGTLGEHLLLPALVADLHVERFDQAEVRVHWLEVPRVRLAQVAVQRAQHRCGWRHQRLLTAEQTRQVDGGDDPGGGAFRVALYARELSGEEGHGVIAQGQVRRQARGGVEVRVAMDLAVSEELRVGQSRNHPEYTLLLNDAKAGLES